MSLIYKMMQVQTIHANLMVIDTIGVLICGLPGIGKSSLSLVLLDRGHCLVSDDAVELYIEKNVLLGRTPEIAKDFLYLNAIGMINVKKQFGRERLIYHHTIDLCITLTSSHEKAHEKNLLGTLANERQFLTVKIPEYQLLADNSSLVIIIETLIRNFKLQKIGYNAYEDFISRKISLCNESK